MAESALVAKISTKGAQQSRRELELVGRQAKKTESNVIQMGDSFTRTGRQASLAASAITGPLGGVASRITAVTSLLTSGAGAATAFGLAMTAAGFSIAEGVAELDRINIELAKTEAILKATGNASGKTSSQLLLQARSIALATLASTQGIQQAQSKLLTFDKIHGQVFDDAIALTQDLATVFGGDASSQATQLGKALQDPVKGLTALNRVGVSFTKTQEDQVKAMIASGDTMSAQAVIVEALKKQVGGAGAAVAKDSLAGKVDTAGQLWSEFSAKLAESSGAFSIANRFMNGLNKTLGMAGHAFEDAKDPVEELFAEIGGIQSQIEKAEAALTDEQGRLGTNYKHRVEWIKQLKAEEQGLRDEIIAISKGVNAERDNEFNAYVAREEKKKEEALRIAEEIKNKQIDADLAFYDAKEAYTIEQNARISEANKKAWQDDAETYGNFLSLKAKEDERVAKLAEQNRRTQVSTLQTTTGQLMSVLDEQSGAYKAAAIVDIGVSTYAAAQKAYEGFQSLPQPYGAIAGGAAAGVAIGVGARNLQGALSARQQGGNLNAGQSTTIAETGLEVITPMNASRVQTASQMKNIMGESGASGPAQINVVNINQSSQQLDIETSTDDSGRIVQIIKDTVPRLIDDPTSGTSKSLSRNIKAERNR